MRIRRVFCALATAFFFVSSACLPVRSQTRGTEGSQTVKDPRDAAASDSPIKFIYQAIDFKLDSCETPERHDLPTT